MKLYTCCHDADCPNYQSASRLFKKWGVRPVLGRDARHFMEFDIPKHWPRSQRRRFVAALREMEAQMPPPVPEPDPARYPCAHCGRASATCLADCSCGHWFPTCTGCLVAGRVAPCPDCALVPTPLRWPAPEPGPREARVRTFRALYRAHFAALVAYARRCARLANGDDRPFAKAGVVFGLVGMRLYDLEQEWASAGIGIGDLDPALSVAEIELRGAAAALGAFMKGDFRRTDPKSIAQTHDLIDAALTAAEPFMADIEASLPAASSASGGNGGGA